MHDFNAVPNIIPVLQRISTAFSGVLPIPAAAFIMTCKKIQTLVSFSVGPLTTPLQQIALVDVIEDTVIAFVLRVFPSIAETFDAPTFPLSLSSLISLLGAVESHISKYADFTLQLRMAAIYQLLYDNEEVAVILSLLNTLYPASQELSLNTNSLSSWLYSIGIAHAPSPTLSEDSQLLFLEPSSLSSRSSTFVTSDYEPYLPLPVSHCSVQDFSSFSISGATSSHQNLSLPSFSRSSSAPNIQMALVPEVVSSTAEGDRLSVGNYDASSIQVSLQDDRTPSPLFTPDPNVSTPTMKPDTPVSRLASDSSGRRHTADISSFFPLSDRPQLSAQSLSPVSSKLFTIRDDPFYNTFHTASEAFSPRPKEGYILDSSSLVAANSDFQILSKSIEGKEKDVPAAFVKTKARRGSNNITVLDNSDTLAGKVERKRVVSMHSMNKENLAVGE